VRKGTRGIVRTRPSGWLSDRYEIEFSPGGRVWVSSRYLRPALYGHGDQAFRRYQANRVGIRLGLFLIFGLPAAVAIIRYYLGGGDTAGLIAALPGALLDQLGQLLGLIALPTACLCLVAIWLWRRISR
jgi:hypothetical protein